MIAQKGLLQPALPQPFGNRDVGAILAYGFKCVQAGVIDIGSDGEWCGQEGLYLI